MPKLDALFSSMGELSIYAIPYGAVEPILPKGGLIKIKKIGIYVKDSFDYNGAQ